MQGFVYPPERHDRRHGPGGYRNYTTYCNWLRDEFMFRCVYCLHREQYYGRGAAFHIDHLAPVSDDPNREVDYTNLYYACATCNTAKLDVSGVPDPCEIAFADCLAVGEDGRVNSKNQTGEAIVKKLALNSEKNVRSRYRWIRTLATLQQSNPALLQEYLGFPEDLPDLRRSRAPSNSKPENVDNCWFALRERGELPSTY